MQADIRLGKIVLWVLLTSHLIGLIYRIKLILNTIIVTCGKITIPIITGILLLGSGDASGST